MALPKSESILADQPATADEAELIARYVKPHPHRGGRAEAWFPEFGYRVATLISYMQSEDATIAQTARHYEMPEEAVRAAIGFYRRNREAIDARITLDLDQ